MKIHWPLFVLLCITPYLLSIKEREINKARFEANKILGFLERPPEAGQPAKTYSCSAVHPKEGYAIQKDQSLLVNAKVDCFFTSAFGKSGEPATTTFDIPKNAFVQMPAFTQEEPMPLTQLTHFPKKGKFFAFQYKPLKGQLRNAIIQVVIRSEPISNNMVQIYRRVPTAHEKKFKPMHTKIFHGEPDKQIADMRILPTGNLQIIEHAADGKLLLVEEAFGTL